MFFIVQIKPLKFDFSVLYYPSIDIKSVFFYTYSVDITIIYNILLGGKYGWCK